MVRQVRPGIDLTGQDGVASARNMSVVIIHLPDGAAHRAALDSIMRKTFPPILMIALTLCGSSSIDAPCSPYTSSPPNSPRSKPTSMPSLNGIPQVPPYWPMLQGIAAGGAVLASLTTRWPSDADTRYSASTSFTGASNPLDALYRNTEWSTSRGPEHRIARMLRQGRPGRSKAKPAPRSASQTIPERSPGSSTVDQAMCLDVSSAPQLEVLRTPAS